MSKHRTGSITVPELIERMKRDDNTDIYDNTDIFVKHVNREISESIRGHERAQAFASLQRTVASQQW